MNQVLPQRLLVVLLFLTFVAPAWTDEPAFTTQADVIYGRKYGLALTMDVVKPKQGANGLGVVVMVSGGWFSRPEMKPMVLAMKPLLDRGYTVFPVIHGSQPKFTIPEILEDVHRAVRWVRFHAKEYGIDPDRIGITGGSAGGHLSLMQGTAGDDGDPKAKDPIDRMSSRVQAVACFFPPTDFLNYGNPGEDAIGRGRLEKFAAPFDFRVMDNKLGKFVNVTEEEKIKEWGRKISPINHVSAKSAPSLIIHGDKDFLVPIQQAEIMVAAKLVVKPGTAHGWGDIAKDAEQIVDWFDVHLKAAAGQPVGAGQ
jgi:acetyl esterase/lipase